MAQTDLPAGSTDGAFNADEQSFFRQGEALESGELMIDDLNEQRLRSRSWRPRLVLMGVAAVVALAGVSLIGGRRQSGEAIAAVSTPTPALSVATALPPPAPAPAAAPSAPTAAAVAVSEDVRPAKVKKAKHAHRNRALARGKHR